MSFPRYTPTHQGHSLGLPPVDQAQATAVEQRLQQSSFKKKEKNKGFSRKRQVEKSAELLSLHCFM